MAYSTDSTVQPPTADWSHQRFPPVRFVTPLLHASQALSKHRNRQQKGPGFVGGPLDGTDGVLVVWVSLLGIGQHPYSGHVHKTRHLVGPQCDVHQQTMSPTSGFSSHVNKRATTENRANAVFGDDEKQLWLRIWGDEHPWLPAILNYFDDFWRETNNFRMNLRNIATLFYGELFGVPSDSLT